MENLGRLVNELRKLPNETQWLEFKHNNYDPEMIGRDISALANSAAIQEKSCAYMLWGVDDETHEIIGTDHNFQTLKKGNQELESWLRVMLSKNADFEFHTVPMNGHTVGVIIIRRATNQTVTFQKTDYIRIGSYTTKLNEYPALQAQLWDRIRNSKFEDRYALQDLGLSEALGLIDHATYFDLMRVPQPSDMKSICHYMLEEKIIAKQDNGLYAITNLGAILIAKRLSDFPRLSRKAARVVQYSGDNRMSLLKDYSCMKGYAVGFRWILDLVEAQIPTQEIINGALREKKTAYPLLAIRELIANALIHQDFSITGAGPTIEIFDKRIEITNPGTPLVDVARIIDNPPKSRNERLAGLMRRFRMCEELGMGWDNIALACEMSRIPSPKIDLYEDSTRVTLFTEMPFSSIPRKERLWACYLHACMKQMQGNQMTNASLRARFGLKSSSAGSISRLIKDAVSEKLIKPFDPTTAPRYMKYIPIWA